MRIKLNFRLKTFKKRINMGNCVGICNSNMSKSKGDIIIEKNSDNETGKYLETQYMKKVIYLKKC